MILVVPPILITSMARLWSMMALWPSPPEPQLPPPPLRPGHWPARTVTAIAVTAVSVILAFVAIRFAHRVARRRSLAQRALRKRASRDALRERAAANGLDWPGLLRWAAPLHPLPPPPEEVVEMSAAALIGAMERRELSAEYVMRCFVARAMAVGRALQCNAEERFEAAVAEAAAADAERARGAACGALHGLPISIKDQIDMAGCDSTCGLACRTFAPSEEDALLVALARAQGAIPFVRTSVPQLLMLPESSNAVWGTACNPYDLGRTCGGSSGGEGALIAARGSPLGIGTDVGGSIRLPAAMCGIAGFKPTNDRVSTRGVTAALRERASGQKEIRASAGPMGRCVADLELLMQARTARSPRSPQVHSRTLRVRCAPA